MSSQHGEDAAARAHENNQVGAGDYVVRQGDCLSSIARLAGHFWETIWHHPANAELKRARQDPNVLLPGDRLTIPPLQLREELKPTAQRHRFLLKGVPAKVRLRLLQQGEPRAGVRYVFTVDGTVHQGTTDADGYLSVPIPPHARQGQLTVGDGHEEREEYSVLLGHLNPVHDVAGVQHRLNNLGYRCAPSGLMDEQTRAALNEFQVAQGLEAGGDVSEAVRAKLSEAHGS